MTSNRTSSIDCFLTKSWATYSSLLSPTDDAGEVEIVVGFAGLCAPRLRRCRRFGCRTRSRHPGFVLGCGPFTGLPGLGLWLGGGGRGGGGGGLRSKRRPRKITAGRTCERCGQNGVKKSQDIMMMMIINIMAQARPEEQESHLVKWGLDFQGQQRGQRSETWPLTLRTYQQLQGDHRCEETQPLTHAHNPTFFTS